MNGANKVNTYDEYITMPKAMPIEKMISIHRQMIDEIGNDPDAVELYGELIETAEKYAAIRAEWAIIDREEKMEKDPLRTSLHNTVILQINVLSRYLRKTGKPALWRNDLGNEKVDRMCRKVMGDFACYLAFVCGICTR